jgi:hypothetical protein
VVVCSAAGRISLSPSQFRAVTELVELTFALTAESFVVSFATTANGSRGGRQRKTVLLRELRRGEAG